MHQRETPASYTTPKPLHPFREDPLPESNIDFDYRALRFKLPPRAKADKLFQQYWERFHPIFPVLDQQETQKAYVEFWTRESSNSQNPLFLYIISVICALSSRTDDEIGPETRDDVSRKYTHIAHEFYDLRTHTNSCFESIQAFLLMGEYFHSVNPQQCWLYIGLAIRTAQSLGLHRPRLITSLSSVRSREAICRVWHLCVMWDRILGMTYGRAIMIDEVDARSLPLPQSIGCDRYENDTLLQGDFSSTTDLTTSSDFFSHSSSLYAVIAGVQKDYSSLDHQAKPGDDDEAFPSLEMLHSALAGDRGLAKWRTSLPLSLTLERVAEECDLRARQASILHQRRVRYIHSNLKY